MMVSTGYWFLWISIFQFLIIAWSTRIQLLIVLYSSIFVKKFATKNNICMSDGTVSDGTSAIRPPYRLVILA